MPFRALDKNNNSRVSYEIVLSEYRQEWKCPFCSSKFSFVNTQAKTKHFRHLVKCLYHTEPETKEHLELKKYIYENLKPKYAVEYEYKIDNRIADVVVLLGGNKIAIECQVSSISLAELEERNASYKLSNTLPIWILYPKHYLKKQKSDGIDFYLPREERPLYYRLKNIERELQNTNWLFYYDPELEMLKRMTFEPKHVESDYCVHCGDDYSFVVGDYDCKTIFSIEEYDFFTPIEVIDRVCDEHPHPKTRSDMELEENEY